MPVPDRDAAYREAAQEIRDDLHRANTTAAILATLAGGAVLLAASGDLPEATSLAHALIQTGKAALLATVVALLVMLKPTIRRAPFLRARKEGFRPETPEERFAALAAIARKKFALLLLAVLGAILGVTCLAIGIELAP